MSGIRRVAFKSALFDALETAIAAHSSVFPNTTVEYGQPADGAFLSDVIYLGLPVNGSLESSAIRADAVRSNDVFNIDVYVGADAIDDNANDARKAADAACEKLVNLVTGTACVAANRPALGCTNCRLGPVQGPGVIGLEGFAVSPLSFAIVTLVVTTVVTPAIPSS